MPLETTTQSAEATARGWPLRALRAFGHFWWDFLVGDTPEVTVATLVTLGIVAGLVHWGSSTAAWAVLPVLVAATLTATVLRGRRASYPTLDSLAAALERSSRPCDGKPASFSPSDGKSDGS